MNEKPERADGSAGTPCYEITELGGGGFQILDSEKRERGRYRDAKTMAVHLAFSIEETDKLRGLLSRIQPYVGRLPTELAEEVRQFLNPCTEKLDCTSYRGRSSSRSCCRSRTTNHTKGTNDR